MSAATASIQKLSKEWKWPLDLRRYDQAAPDGAELREIRSVLKQEWRGRFQTNLWIPRLERIVRPVLDAEDLFQPDGRDRSPILWIVLTEVLARRATVLSWSPRIWATVCCGNRTAFTERYGVAGTSRLPFLAVAILLNRPVKLEGCGVFERVLLAQKVFGHKVVDASTKQVADVLKDWGYGVSHRAHNESVLAELMLLSGSPLLQDLSRDALAGQFEKCIPIQRRYAMQRISQALYHLGFFEAPLQHGWNLPRSGQSPDLAANVDKRWAGYVERWFSTSTLAPGTRMEVRYMLLKVGRWVTATHPEAASPELWTQETAAQWVAAVCRMRVGEWHNQVRRIAEHGKPLSPPAMVGHCGMLRVFFRDCQEWEWFPRRFDPRRCLRSPASVRRLIGPNPRVIADDVWAKLVWAGLNLTPADLPQGSTIYYPVEMVRALALVWLFGGLRSDEISRLQVGAIRWKETVEEGASARVCLLNVPVNKTSTAFVKPVDPIVSDAVEAWEKARPIQPAFPDRKTGDLVHLLFTYRARPLGDRYLNRMLIPLLCRKAGVPPEDARGNITSHRGRSTIASQLYNAKQPLSLFELQAWLGHRSPNATQYYAKITPTKLSKAYNEAGYFERNLRSINVLIDQDAVRKHLPEGDAWKYYDLGHGYCTYDFFDQCQHRMACAKCSFYKPKGSTAALLLEGKTNLLRMRQEIPLLDAELAAIDDGVTALGELLKNLADVPTPEGLTPRELQAQSLVQIRALGEKEPR
jgi:integrase